MHTAATIAPGASAGKRSVGAGEVFDHAGVEIPSTIQQAHPLRRGQAQCLVEGEPFECGGNVDGRGCSQGLAPGLIGNVCRRRGAA